MELGKPTDLDREIVCGEDSILAFMYVHLDRWVEYDEKEKQKYEKLRNGKG